MLLSGKPTVAKVNHLEYLLWSENGRSAPLSFWTTCWEVESLVNKVTHAVDAGHDIPMHRVSLDMKSERIAYNLNCNHCHRSRDCDTDYCNIHRTHHTVVGRITSRAESKAWDFPYKMEVWDRDGSSWAVELEFKTSKGRTGTFQELQNISQRFMAQMSLGGRKLPAISIAWRQDSKEITQYA